MRWHATGSRPPCSARAAGSCAARESSRSRCEPGSTAPDALPGPTGSANSDAHCPRSSRSLTERALRRSRACAVSGAVRDVARRRHGPGRRGRLGHRRRHRGVVGRRLTMRADGRRAAIAVGRLPTGRWADGPVWLAHELPEDEWMDHGGFLSLQEGGSAGRRHPSRRPPRCVRRSRGAHAGASDARRPRRRHRRCRHRPDR